MTANDQVAEIVAKSLARTKAADDAAILAAEAVSFGVFDKYVEAKVADIERRINEHFGAGERRPWLADPASLGPVS